MHKKLVFLIVIFGLSLLFAYLAKKHKGEEKEAKYRKISDFFASLPLVLIGIGLVIFILLIILLE